MRITSLYAGVLVHGMPRPAGHTVSVCGVHIGYRMPDVTSIALGGGSVVRWDTDRDTADTHTHTHAEAHTQAQGKCHIGPVSVGSQLNDRCVCKPHACIYTEVEPCSARSTLVLRLRA